eukprot:scaffold227728_cov39-Tisochrysis_lutea.AAC.1
MVDCMMQSAPPALLLDVVWYHTSPAAPMQTHGSDEIAHVRLLRRALGSDAVDQPEMDIGAAFEAAADAAVGSTLSPSFSPYANDISFFIGAFIFEDVGVTAYK